MEESEEDRPRRKRRTPAGPSYLDRMSPEDRLEWMRVQYQQNSMDDAQGAMQRAMDDLRMRADGSPSARRPAATLPLALWATVQDPPDGGEDDGTEGRLAHYREWLRLWKEKGLYDGPTKLKRVNDDPDS